MTALSPQVPRAARIVLAVAFAGFACSFAFSLYMMLVNRQAFVRRTGWVAVDLSDPVQWVLAGLLLFGLGGTLTAAWYVLTRPILRG